MVLLSVWAIVIFDVTGYPFVENRSAMVKTINAETENVENVYYANIYCIGLHGKSDLWIAKDTALLNSITFGDIVYDHNGNQKYEVVSYDMAYYLGYKNEHAFCIKSRD
jgi:hypothetical protein